MSKMKITLTLSCALCVLVSATTAGGAGIGPWELFETSFETTNTYQNPFTDLEVKVTFRQGDKQWVMPAFWAGGGKWTVRFAPPAEGEYRYHVECSDPANTDLAGKEGTLRVGKQIA